MRHAIGRQDVQTPRSGALPLGVATSPELIAKGGSMALTILEATGIPADFTPSVFIGHDSTLERISYTDVVAAHEMGHALSLVHTEDDEQNLMYPAAVDACRPYLEQWQVDEMVGIQSLEAGLPCDSAHDLVRGIVRGLLAKHY